MTASLLHALNDAATVAVPMIFPLLYADKFIITSYSQIGIISNLGLLVTLAVQILIVKMSCRFEYKNLLLSSSLGISLSLACLTISNSFLTLLLLFIIMRIATSVYHPLVIAWISKTQASSNLDRAMGIQSGSGNIGVLLAFISVGLLSQHFGWKKPLLFWSLLAFVLAIATYFMLTGISSSEADRPSMKISAWMSILKKIKKFIPGFILGGLGWSVIIYYAPSLLTHEFSVPMDKTGIFLSLWVGLGTISGYSYGMVSRRLGRSTVFLLSIAGAAFSLAIIGLGRSQTLVVVGLLLFGMFLLMIYPSLHTFVGSLASNNEQTQAFSWVSNIQIISGAFIALLSGFMSDWFGIRAPFLLASFLATVCLLFYVVNKPAEGK